MKTIIGLTGPTGAGKSTVTAAAMKAMTVIDCDAVCRAVYRENALCKKALVEAFGEQVLKEDQIDRKALAAAAFCDSEHTVLLNDVSLPFIIEQVLEQAENAQTPAVLLDAPTLYESGLDEICCAVVAVLCERDKRKDRIILRDNISEPEALLRLSAEKSDSFFQNRADYILYNNGEPQETVRQFDRVVKKITEEKTDE